MHLLTGFDGLVDHGRQGKMLIWFEGFQFYSITAQLAVEESNGIGSVPARVCQALDNQKRGAGVSGSFGCMRLDHLDRGDAILFLACQFRRVDVRDNTSEGALDEIITCANVGGNWKSLIGFFHVNIENGHVDLLISVSDLCKCSWRIWSALKERSE